MLIATLNSISYVISVGIAVGMAYLAEHSFVHRDLASRNVLLDSKGTPMVADFGLSKSLYNATYYTRTASAATEQLPLRWLAPELLSAVKDGSPAALDALLTRHADGALATHHP